MLGFAWLTCFTWFALVVFALCLLGLTLMLFLFVFLYLLIGLLHLLVTLVEQTGEFAFSFTRSRSTIV